MLARCIAAAAVFTLNSCSALGGGDVPAALAGMCIGTIQNGGCDLSTNIKLSQFIDHLRSKSFQVSWAGSSISGTLQAIQLDKFAGKTTEIVFEVERHPRPANALCPAGLAVLARAKVNGEVLNQYASEDIVQSLAEQYRNANPLPKTKNAAAPSIPHDSAPMLGQAAPPTPGPQPNTSQIAVTDDFERSYTADYRTCMSTGDAKDGVTSGITDCLSEEIDRQDAVLNSIYRRLIRAMDHSRSGQLRTSERAWIQQRDSKCQSAADAESGGTLANIIYAHCILDKTIRRSHWLNSQRA